MHDDIHPHAGQTVKIKSTVKGTNFNVPLADQDYWIEDWWDHLTGGSWMFAENNVACLHFAVRTGTVDKVPLDNEVVYGKVGRFGVLMHVSELEFS